MYLGHSAVCSTGERSGYCKGQSLLSAEEEELAPLRSPLPLPFMMSVSGLSEGPIK